MPETRTQNFMRDQESGSLSLAAWRLTLCAWGLTLASGTWTCLVLDACGLVLEACGLLLGARSSGSVDPSELMASFFKEACNSL